MIKVNGLKKTFVTERGDVQAVAGVSFEVEQGEFFTLLGPSGCGKSTTLRCIAGLERPDEGEIIIGAGAPGELKIEANLTASQGGVTIEGSGRTVELLGSLHFSDYEGNGNSLRLHPDTRLAGDEDRIRNAPHTRNPILIYTGLRVTLWRSRL